MNICYHYKGVKSYDQQFYLTWDRVRKGSENWSLGREYRWSLGVERGTIIVGRGNHIRHVTTQGYDMDVSDFQYMVFEIV